MAHIRLGIDYEKFRESVFKGCFWGRESRVDKQDTFRVIDRAFDLACRNLPSRVSDRMLFNETALYIRIGYNYLKGWC